ncbi:MAG TPA: hypothetical protein VGC67_10390 [Cellulomonas sp.]
MTAVAGAVCRMWARDLAFTLRISVRRVMGIVVLVLVLLFAAGLGALLAMVSGAALSGPAVLPESIISGMLRSACAVTFGIAAVIGVAVHLAVPPFGALQVVLELSPLGRARSVIGARLPILVGAVVLSCSVASMSGNVVVQTARDGWFAALGLCALVMVVVSQCVAWALMMLLTWMLGRVLRLRHQAAAGAAGLVAICVVVLLVYPDIFSLRSEAEAGFRSRDLLLHRGAALLAAGSLPGALVLLGWLVLSVLAVRWTAGLEVDRDQPAFRPVGRRVPTPRGVVLSTARLEAVQALRSPHAVSALIVMAACVGLGWWSSRMPFISDSSSVLFEAACLPPFLLAVFATGRSRAHQWIGAALTADRGWSTWPRALGLAAVGVCGALVAFVVTLAVTGTSILGGVTIARCAMVMGVALLAGSVIPYGDEQPMSAVAGVVGSATGLGVVGLVADVGGPAAGIAVMLSLATVALVLYGVSARRSEVMVSAV